MTVKSISLDPGTDEIVILCNCKVVSADSLKIATVVIIYPIVAATPGEKIVMIQVL